MKLLVDARCFQDSAYVRRGIGRNTEGILRHARRFLPAPLEMIGLLDPAMSEIPDDLGELFDSVQYHATPPHPSEGQAIFFNPSPMTHSPTRILPLLAREHILSCAFSHDLVPLDDPDYYLPGLERRQTYLAALMALKQYRLHAPNSRHTARTVQEKLGIADSAMVVCGSVLLSSFATFDPAKTVPHPSVCRFKPGEYFIMVAGEDPRKNTRNTLAAHAVLNERGIRVPLVIVGLYAPITIEKLLRFHREQGGRNRDVQFLHGIDDAQLCPLYARSKACLCPSLSEGFSMPVVEAMACGAPVLASDCPAQVELVEQPDALFSPRDPKSIAAIIERANSDAAWLADLRTRQASMPLRFAEDEVAARIWMHVRRHLPADSFTLSSRLDARPQLAILTPYPHRDEVEVGYVPTLLREISQWADITVFSDESQPRLDPWVRSFEPLSALAFCATEFDRVVAVLGLGDQAQRYFWLAERFGGACLLYASQLGPFYANAFGEQRAAAVAQSELRREVTRSELRHWLANPALAGSRFLREVRGWADPLVVHSRLACQTIERDAPGSVEFLPPCVVPLVDEAGLGVDMRATARSRLKLDPKRIHLLALGDHSVENTRLIVHALEQLRAWGIDAQLHCVGRVSSAKEIAAALGLGEHVTWRPDENRVDWLAAVDLGICLTNGNVGIPFELLQLLAAGIPTVANREMVQGFALPAHALEVPDVPSALLIAERWRQAIETGEYRERLTIQRAEFVDQRRPERHVRALLHQLRVA